MERFEKPAWLRDFLSNLNWDILGMELYVGNAIELAIDWLLDIVNTVVEWANMIGAWWDDFRQEAIDVFNTFVDWLNELWQIFTDWIDTWLDQLNEWWLARLSDVQDLIDVVKNWLLDRINEIRQGLDQLLVWWDNFRTDILPGLLSFTWFTDWWGQVGTTFREWWAITLEGLLESFRIILEPLIEQINSLSSLADLFKEFFTDPVEWLWSRFTDWFLGPEE